MAYQSRFTGSQIDDVIEACRTGENLSSLSRLTESLDSIESHGESINSINTNIINMQIDIDNRLSTSGDTMDGQILKLVDCRYHEARDKALIKITGSTSNGEPKFTEAYSPIYSCLTTSGDISYGIIPTGDASNSHKMVWRYISNSDYNKTENQSAGSKELASITTLGQVFGAVWNDYAEYRSSVDSEPGRVVCECGDGTLKRSVKRLQPGAEIISDTFGFAIGKTAECNVPIAVSGRVLAYPHEQRNHYKPGDAVCAGPNGTVSKMTRREIKKYPERIIGTVSEIPTYETWGEYDTKVNDRIWIRIK